VSACFLINLHMRVCVRACVCACVKLNLHVLVCTCTMGGFLVHGNGSIILFVYVRVCLCMLNFSVRTVP
jgi:hypothetical protein